MKRLPCSIFFMDVPGFMTGKESEEAAILREGAREH